MALLPPRNPVPTRRHEGGSRVTARVRYAAFGRSRPAKVVAGSRAIARSGPQRHRWTGQKFEVAPQTWCLTQSSVCGDQGDVQHLRQRNIRRVVDRQVRLKLPTPWEQRAVRHASYGQRQQVGQCQVGAPCGQLSGTPQPSQHRCDLQVDQLRGGERLRCEPLPGVVPIGGVVSEGRRQDAGINDDHGLRAAPRLPSRRTPRRRLDRRRVP